MSLSVFIMYAVAAILGTVGLWLLVQLRRPQGPARVYVYRMVGIMGVAAGIVLAFSATAMWRWSAEG